MWRGLALVGVFAVTTTARAESPSMDVGPWDARRPEMMDAPFEPIDAPFEPIDAPFAPLDAGARDTSTGFDGGARFDAPPAIDAGAGRVHTMACASGSMSRAAGGPVASLALLAVALVARRRR
jgi:hypothetical protein